MRSRGMGFLYAHIILTFIGISAGEFLVNVKTQAGNVVKQSIRENITDSYIVLEYEDWDLTKITQLVDFKSALSIFQVILYGEIELNQSAAQIICFINHLPPTEFIEADAVSKLRQKNQDAIRISENQLGEISRTADLAVNYASSDLLSHHIKKLCEGTDGAIYTTESDIQNASKETGRDYEAMMSSTTRLTAIPLSRCSESPLPSQQCSCRYRLSIDWYPCSLRYCKGVVGNKPTTYKCGIKTCGITRLFEFPVKERTKCWWDQ